MRWNFTPKTSARPTDIMAFIDEGSEIDGKYTFTGTGTILLNGKVRGEVVSADTIVVGEKAVVNATIRAESVIIKGPWLDAGPSVSSRHSSLAEESVRAAPPSSS